MIYGIDIDGVLCLDNFGHTAENFSRRLPIEKNIAAVQQLKKEGHTIILHTARKSADEGVIVATIDWLKKNNVPYDELAMNKPICDIYIDDKATCTFPETRSLYFACRPYGYKDHVDIIAYLHTERLVNHVEQLLLPDRYVVSIEKGMVVCVSARGEFLRDEDLKYEAMDYIKLILRSKK